MTTINMRYLVNLMILYVIPMMYMFKNDLFESVETVSVNDLKNVMMVIEVMTIVVIILVMIHKTMKFHHVLISTMVIYH
jgi:hypothetical protein